MPLIGHLDGWKTRSTTVYDSYSVDPRYQIYLTISWTVLLGASTLVALPAVARYAIAHRGLGDGWLLRDQWRRRAIPYAPLIEKNGPPTPGRPSPTVSAARALIQRVTLTNLPAPLPRIRIITLLLLLLIPALILATVFPESQLAENPNRLGFIALACLPPLFLLSAKASPLSLLSLPYNRINILHRWLGRALFVTALAHGSTWIAQWQQQQSTASHLAGLKEQYGIMALSFLALLFFTSWRPVRTYSYPLFFVCHVVGFLGFLVAISLHTIYSRSWIGYGVVPIVRLLRESL